MSSASAAVISKYIEAKANDLTLRLWRSRVVVSRPSIFSLQLCLSFISCNFYYLTTPPLPLPRWGWNLIRVRSGGIINLQEPLDGRCWGLVKLPPTPLERETYLQLENGRVMILAELGDLVAKTHSRKTLRHLDNHSEGVVAILFVGDLAYPNPSKDHKNWDNWWVCISFIERMTLLYGPDATGGAGTTIPQCNAAL